MGSAVCANHHSTASPAEWECTQNMATLGSGVSCTWRVTSQDSSSGTNI
jgi:hypothetical protein